MGHRGESSQQGPVEQKNKAPESEIKILGNSISDLESQIEAMNT